MKKFLLIIPFLFCFVLSSIPSLTVAAAKSDYISFPEFSERYPEASAESQYFFFNYTHEILNTDDWRYYYSYFIHPLGSVEVSKDSNGLFVFHCNQGFRYGSAYTSNFGSYGYGGHLNYDLGLEFKYDPKTDTFISPLYDDPITISNIKTTLTDETFGDLYVEFTPELKGLVDYKVDINGKKYSTEGLEFSVINKSFRDYQFAIFIVNKGEEIEFKNNYFTEAFDKETDGYSNGLFYSNKPIFAYVKNLWFETIFRGTRTKVNAPSAWHLITAGREIHDTIYWHQMKLEKGHEYDVVVVACQVNPFHTIEADCPLSYVGDIRFHRFENTPFLAGDEYPFETYRSSFTVASNTPFDVKNKESLTGAIAYDPDGNIDDLFDNIEGYYDSKNDDELVLTPNNSKFSDIGYRDSSNNPLNNSYDYTNSSSFKLEGALPRLLSDSRSFFSFFVSVLNYFPSQIYYLVFLALWAFFILALIRRIK